MWKIKQEQNSDKQKELTEKLFKTDLPNQLEVFEKRIQESGSKGHIVGDSWTIADFVFATLFTSTFLNEANPAHDTLREILYAKPHLK